MKIEHKMEPIEHWIVDGKAYRLATQKDIGKKCYFDDDGFESAIHRVVMGKIRRVCDRGVFRFIESTAWKYAYVEDESLLKPIIMHDALPIGCAIPAGHVVGINADNKIVPVILNAKDNKQHPTKPIDWTKPVRTKDGRSVRVLCTDGPGEYPVVGFMDGNSVPQTWTPGGCFSIKEPGDNDIENAPQRIQREYWVNVYTDFIADYSTKEIADKRAEPDRLSCVKITIDCEEGEGL